ncbi:MAG TPA: XrtA system polysaccharide deacetylase [Candidatus Polarisedimenticolaceae bacterium]|nr:XrtA system polysaccharide deacetylase [Candidatus Polarisedimenticolaceae bacterium]
MGRQGDGVLNAMTVDVEDYFQVSAFEDVVDRSEWARLPSRVEASTARLLDLFDRFEVRATFFVLGWIGENHPALVREISARGHEVACHGYDHKLLYEQEPEAFRRDTVKSREILQDLSGQPVVGYRAASFSIGRDNLWTLDVLAEAGFTYDSSVFPIVHDRYGMPGAPRHIHRLKTPGGHSLVEVPPTTVRIGKLTLPAAGGGYLRLLPLGLTKWALSRLNRHERQPAIVYIHPWEVDPGQPRIRTRLTTSLRHYTGLAGVERKLGALMQRYRFGPLCEIVRQLAEQDERNEPAVLTR